MSFSRRNRRDQWSPGERAIQDAVDVVETMGASLDLTRAVNLLAQARDAVADHVDAGPSDAGPVITLRGALELVTHEAIVQEAYKDSKGIWTWGIGVTDASGHGVMRYKDNPQPIERCLEIYIWLLKTRYAPDVLKAFAGCQLTEAQFAAALSFHYNTGAILKAEWVKAWLAGDIASARAQFMNWRKPPEIIPRREKERDLFFDGRWSGDGRCNVYQVRKPSYAPDWASVKRIDVSAAMQAAIAGGA